LVTLVAVPGSLLAEGFRRAVLEFLVDNDTLSEELRSRMLDWRAALLRILKFARGIMYTDRIRCPRPNGGQLPAGR
jgi:hypothetical protein